MYIYILCFPVIACLLSLAPSLSRSLSLSLTCHTTHVLTHTWDTHTRGSLERLRACGATPPCSTLRGRRGSIGLPFLLCQPLQVLQ